MGGLSATLRGLTGQKQNGFQSVFLEPYGISHTYKCQGKNYSKVWFLDTAISLHTSWLQLAFIDSINSD